MASLIALNPQDVLSGDVDPPSETPHVIGSVGPVSTDEDTHAAYIVATVNIASVGDPGTGTFQCYRCDAAPEIQDTVIGEQVGPDYSFGVASTSPGAMFTVRFVDPDPPAGGHYAIVAIATETDPFGVMSTVSLVAYTF